MIRLLISGFSGFMGSAVKNLASQNPNFEIVGGIDRVPCEGYSVYSSFEDVDVEADVIIDFGSPALTDSLLAYCKKTGTPAVICTTGLTEDTKQNVYNTADNVAVFYSANMSLGANLVAKLAKKAASLLADSFDIEIVEAHHRRKLDAPSGTALMMADEIKDALPDNDNVEYCYDRASRRTPRPANEIGIHAIRGGNIVGDHEIMFISDNETVTLSHKAFSREVFAFGALKAAEFLFNKPAGLYSMNNIVSLD